MGERGFSVTKRLVDHRESLSIASLTGQRVILEAIGTYGSASKVNITSALIHDHRQGHRNYQERLENERKEKLQRDANLRKERESKKKRLEDKEKSLLRQLEFHEARRKEHEQTIDKSKDVDMVRAAFAGHKLLLATMQKTQKELDGIKDEKFKLAEKRRGKNQ